MKSRIIASVMGLISTSIVCLGCGNEDLSDTTEIAPSALGEEASVEAERGVSAGGALAASIPASRETSDATDVSRWEVSRDPATDSIEIRAFDIAGEAVGELALEFDGQTFALRMGEDSLRLDASGEAVSDTLPTEGRELFGRFQLDLANARVEYSDTSCFITMLTVSVGSILCGAGTASVCAAIPVGVCMVSKHCGNNVCAT